MQMGEIRDKSVVVAPAPGALAASPACNSVINCPWHGVAGSKGHGELDFGVDEAVAAIAQPKDEKPPTRLTFQARSCEA